MLVAMTTTIDDTNGLICGFRLNPQGRPTPITLTDIPTVDELLAAPVWLHFNAADVRARKWINNCAALPPSAREHLLASVRHVGFEPIEDGIGAVLGDMHHDLDVAAEGVDMLRLYVDQRLLITTRRTPLQSVDRLRRDMLGGHAAHRPVRVVYHLVAHIADVLDKQITHLGEIVDETEERVLTGAVKEEGRELGRARRFLARLRRHLLTQRAIDVEQLVEDWDNEEDEATIQRCINRLEAVAQDLELVQHRARIVQEEITAQLSDATNRNMMFLSIVTTLFLPITLISGVFGMNLMDLPLQHTPGGFFLVMVLMGATFMASVAVLRWRRLL